MSGRYALANVAARYTADDLAKLRQRPVLSPDEASALTGLSRSSIFRLIETGELTRRKVGNRVLIPTASVLALGGDAG